MTFNLASLGDLEFRRRRYEESAALYREALSGATAAVSATLLLRVRCSSPSLIASWGDS